MAYDDRDFYIIKKRNGTLWNYFYDVNVGIMTRQLKNSIWTGTKCYKARVKNNFSLMLLPNDLVYLLYQDLAGNIYVGNGSVTVPIFSNQDNRYKVYFDGVVHGDLLHLFYSVYDENSKKTTIFHQSADQNMKKTSLYVMDKFDGHYSVPFMLYSGDEKLYVVYQKFFKEQKIGYKELCGSQESFSDFYEVDSCSEQYACYSAYVSGEKPSILYVKADGNRHSLVYRGGGNGSHEGQEIFSSKRIDSCTLMKYNSHIYAVWVEKNKICCSFSTSEDGSFSTPPYQCLLHNQSIIKAHYLDNHSQDSGYIKSYQVYMPKSEPTKPYVLSDLQNIYDSPADAGFNSYFYKKILQDIGYYKEKAAEQQSMDRELEDRLREERAKVLAFEERIKNIEKEYLKFEEIKQELYDSLYFYQNRAKNLESKVSGLEETRPSLPEA